ncbi:MAG TPA: potassium-transporting ATPase subunit KdpC [Phycisphaerae bacterium]|nr:potassium-transporting ATPase subunit KdpC [Phycisphaerae bacterium]
MFGQLRTACMMLLVFTLLTGLAYPLAITAAGQALFPRQANGSLIIHGGKTLGSDLIGQPFDDPRYFWSRPSATTPQPYNAAASTGSNLSIGNPDQLKAIADRVARLRQADPELKEPIPADLVMASGSGLDPHISPAAADIQISRVARVRHMDVTAVRQLVEEMTETRQWWLFGMPRVNVLRLNLALDGIRDEGPGHSWKDAI